MIPLAAMIVADWNYKLDDDEKAEKLYKQIKRNGQLENIIVRRLPSGAYEVTNGNHRYKTFIRLEMAEAMCFNLGSVSDSAAKRIAMETNETRFESDQIKMAKVIKDIAFEEGAEFTMLELEETMPFDKQELEAMGELLNFDWGPGEGGEGGEGGEEGGKGKGKDKPQHTCSECCGDKYSGK